MNGSHSVPKEALMLIPPWLWVEICLLSFLKQGCMLDGLIRNLTIGKCKPMKAGLKDARAPNYSN